MRRLALLGLNHTTAPLAVREKIAFEPAQRDTVMASLREQLKLSELVMLSTCNRVELYMVRSSHDPAAADFFPRAARCLADIRGIAPETFEPHLYLKNERAVVEHLFAVAASLDSMVLGETQILGQVRQAYEQAQSTGMAGSLLNTLFQQAIAAAKQVMTQTRLGKGRVSVASVAVDYARRIFDSFTDKTVLSIGAGKMSELVLRQFADLSPKRLLVCNRDLSKAQALARQFKGEAADMSALRDCMVAADIVVTGTGSAQPIITRRLFDGVLKQRRYRPVFLIDMALPRDVEAEVGQADHVYLYNLDDLQQAASAAQSGRLDSVEAARAIVRENVAQYMVAHRGRELGPLIEQLYQHHHDVAQAELERTLAKLPNVGDAERGHLEDFARRLVNKLLHEPVTTLRTSSGVHATPAQYAHALEMLFGLKSPEKVIDAAPDQSDAAPDQSLDERKP